MVQYGLPYSTNMVKYGMINHVFFPCFSPLTRHLSPHTRTPRRVPGVSAPSPAAAAASCGSRSVEAPPRAVPVQRPGPTFLGQFFGVKMLENGGKMLNKMLETC